MQGRESQRYDGLDSFRHETIKWDENEIDYAHKTDDGSILDHWFGDTTALFDENDDNNNGYADDCSSFIKKAKPWSPKRSLQRKVSFADAVGLDLASIKIMTEGRDTPPNLENYFTALQIQESCHQMMPQFAQPITNFNEFLSKLNLHCVSLESVEVKNYVITGLVKVRNLAYHKTVLIHYTADGWRSKKRVPCYYVNPASDSKAHNTHDTFSFQVELDSTVHRVEFCVSYDCQGQMYWDNNDGANYLLVREKVK